MLGEFLAAAVLLSTTIKFEGRLILQAQGGGEIPLLMAECSNNLEVRAIARGAETGHGHRFQRAARLGHLAITIDPLRASATRALCRWTAVASRPVSKAISRIPNNWQPGCGWPATAKSPPACCFNSCRSRSPRMPARGRAVGTRLHLAETVERDEVLELEQETLLYRLFHEDKVRLFAGEAVRFACSCSRERCHNALLSIGPTELLKLLEEEPEVEDGLRVLQHPVPLRPLGLYRPAG